MACEQQLRYDSQFGGDQDRVTEVLIHFCGNLSGRTFVSTVFGDCPVTGYPCRSAFTLSPLFLLASLIRLFGKYYHVFGNCSPLTH